MTFNFNMGNNAFGGATTQQYTFGAQPSANRIGGVFGQLGGIATSGNIGAQQPSNKLSQQDMNKDLQTHRQDIQRAYDQQRNEFQHLSQQVFEQDKQNYFTNQEVDNIVDQLTKLQQEQVFVKQAMQQISVQQTALFDSLQKEEEKYDTQQMRQIFYRVLECQRALEQYKTAGLVQLKRINELSGYLAYISQQLR